MDPRVISAVLDILGYMAVAHTCHLVDEVNRHGRPEDIIALAEARTNIATCARAIRDDYSEIADMMLQQVSQDIVENVIDEAVAKHSDPR